MSPGLPIAVLGVTLIELNMWQFRRRSLGGEMGSISLSDDGKQALVTAAPNVSTGG